VLHSSGSPTGAAPKPLDALSEDLAFREFFRLQESFEWNGRVAASRQVGGCILRLYSGNKAH